MLCAQSVLFWATLVLICTHAYCLPSPLCKQQRKKAGVFFFVVIINIARSFDQFHFSYRHHNLLRFTSPFPYLSESFETTNHFLFRIIIRILSVWCFIAVFPPTRKGSLTALRVGERGVQLNIFNRAQHALNQIFLV